MLKIHLKERNKQFDIIDYDISFPFSAYADNLDDNVNVYWNLNSIQTKRIKTGFRLLYACKLDFSFENRPDVTVTDKGSLYEGKDASGNEFHAYDIHFVNDDFALQHILFSKNALMLINEKQRNAQRVETVNLPRQKLPHFLLKNKAQAIANIQFFIEYHERLGYEIGGEEITIFLNLYLEK